jgi:hypothetical protein
MSTSSLGLLLHHRLTAFEESRDMERSLRPETVGLETMILVCERSMLGSKLGLIALLLLAWL